ncbi:MAG TPA: biotin--[acetyl-CoA-carboxylase] ligase [Microbacteriaceae bacterium]|nr:biotin--[acetyl-CoA-carboxylase] ligase [Microbacteriaceae bacterium]
MKNSADSPCDFHKSAALVERFLWLPETGSTNDDASALARQGAPDFTVVVTDTQTAGRGRLGRVWTARSGKTLAISVLLRPTELFERPDSLAWLPLLAGVAMSRAVRAELDALLTHEPEERAPLEVSLKWPNDVLIHGFKVSGILTELVADESAVVIGSGINLTLDEHDLPTLTSTSVLLASGAQPDADRLLSAYLQELRRLTTTLREHAGNAETSGLRALVEASCGTIGQSVRVELPGGQELHGTAEGIDAAGRVSVRDSSGVVRFIAAGDVTHLRLEA